MIRRKSFSILVSLAFFTSISLYGGSLSELRKANPNRPTDEEIEAEMQAIHEAYNEYIVYVSEIRNALAEELKSELNLHYCGDRGRMHLKVERLGGQFQAERRATFEEARALILTVVDKFVHAVNAHEKLQPFLEAQPFTNKQVVVSIAFKGINGRYADGSVSNVYYTANDEVFPKVHHLFYDIKDPFTTDLVDFLEEPYEEAVKHNQLANIEDLAIHRSNEKEEILDRIFYDFREKMRKKHRLECWAVGGSLVENIETIGGKFVAVYPASQEKARYLILDMAQQVLKAINECEELQPYLAETPFPADRLRLRLCFKKKRTYSPYRDGTMESATLEDGLITYFKKKPFEEEAKLGYFSSDVPVYAIESYQEAQEIVEKEPDSSESSSIWEAFKRKCLVFVHKIL